MRRRRVEVVVVLLDVLPMIAFLVGQPEQSLFQDWIFAVPQRDCQAQPLFNVADPCESVVAPAIGAAACVIVRKVIPRVSVSGVILAHRSPLTLADVRRPQPPRRWARLPKSAIFDSCRRH